MSFFIHILSRSLKKLFEKDIYYRLAKIFVEEIPIAFLIARRVIRPERVSEIIKELQYIEKSKEDKIKRLSDELARLSLPDKSLLRLYKMNVKFSIRNLEKYLNYKPRTSFDEGLELIKEWLQFMKYLNDNL